MLLVDLEWARARALRPFYCLQIFSSTNRKSFCRIFKLRQKWMAMHALKNWIRPLFSGRCDLSVSVSEWSEDRHPVEFWFFILLFTFGRSHSDYDGNLLIVCCGYMEVSHFFSWNSQIKLFMELLLATVRINETKIITQMPFNFFYVVKWIFC